MRTVYKYHAGMEPLKVDLPIGYRVVHTVMDRHEVGITFWIEQDVPDGDIDLDIHVATFQIYGTGHPIHDGWVHRGSAVGDVFVWHLYEQVRP